MTGFQLSMLLRSDVRLGVALWKEGGLVDYATLCYDATQNFDIRASATRAELLKYREGWDKRGDDKITVAASHRLSYKDHSFGASNRKTKGYQAEIEKALEITGLPVSHIKPTVANNDMAEMLAVIAESETQRKAHKVELGAIAVGIAAGFCAPIDMFADHSKALAQLESRSPVDLKGLVEDIARQTDRIAHKYCSGEEVTAGELLQLRGLFTFAKLADLTPDTRRKFAEFGKEIKLLTTDRINYERAQAMACMKNKADWEALAKRIEEMERGK